MTLRHIAGIAVGAGGGLALWFVVGNVPKDPSGTGHASPERLSGGREGAIGDRGQKSRRGSIRPVFGPDSGPIPHGKNAVSSSDSAAPKPRAEENARPRPGEKAAAAQA